MSKCWKFALTIAIIGILIYLIVNFTTHQQWISLINSLPGSRPIADTNRDILEVIESRGFNYEQHFITTKDGYILQLVRIVNPFFVNNNNSDDDEIKRNQLKPVLLHHGFQCSGSFWITASEGALDENGIYNEFDEDGNLLTNGTYEIGNNLGFVLATKKYDVWLANYRGNSYSTNHTYLNPDKDKEYWKFSIDEMVKYDLPLEIDYILKKTNRTSLSYIGHSQGNILMFFLMSLDDERAQKIKPFIAIAPAFYINDLSKVDTIARYFSSAVNLFRKYPGHSFVSERTRKLVSNLCHNVIFRKVCSFLLYEAAKFDSNNAIPERLPAYLYHETMGASTWNVAHVIQISLTQRPSYFDYGSEEENLKIYGNKTENGGMPPIYDAKKINSTNIALIYAVNDFLTTPNDVHLLKNDLKHLKLLDDYNVTIPTYGHNELVIAKDSGKVVHTRILNLLSKYSG